MKVRVLFFASMRDAAGGPAEREISLSGGAQVAELWNLLTVKNERLRAFERSMLCAVNSEYASMEQPLRDGDEVAFFPPVNGG